MTPTSGKVAFFHQAQGIIVDQTTQQGPSTQKLYLPRRSERWHHAEPGFLFFFFFAATRRLIEKTKGSLARTPQNMLNVSDVKVRDEEGLLLLLLRRPM